MPPKLIAVVTGSNRGIGAGIVSQLATTQHPRGPLLVYATSRAGSKSQHVTPQHDNEIRFEKLDISSKPAIKDFIRKIVKLDRAEGGGGHGVDILINNAGINLNRNETYEDAEKTIDVNYRSVRDMCQLFLNLGNMGEQNRGARIVNVSSTGSGLGIHGEEVQERFRGAGTVEDVDALADEYLKLYKEDALEASGFGGGAISYQVSKACVNALTRVLAKENPEVLINCCCPGWVDTDMGNLIGRPSKTVEDGAKIPVRLAVGDIEDVSGEYWGNDGVHDKGDGKVQRW